MVCRDLRQRGLEVCEALFAEAGAELIFEFGVQGSDRVEQSMSAVGELNDASTAIAWIRCASNVAPMFELIEERIEGLFGGVAALRELGRPRTVGAGIAHDLEVGVAELRVPGCAQAIEYRRVDDFVGEAQQCPDPRRFLVT